MGKPPETAAQTLAALQMELVRLKKHVKNYESLIARITRALANSYDSRTPRVTVGDVRQHLGELHLLSDEVANAAAGLANILDERGVPK
jgi:hypothetical protein